MQKLGAFWTELFSGKRFSDWDTTTFGSVAVALNVAAISLLTVTAIHEFKQPKRRAQDAFPKKATDFLGLSGALVWYVSTLYYLAYLNPAFVYFGTGALMLAFLLLWLKSDRRKNF